MDSLRRDLRTIFERKQAGLGDVRLASRHALQGGLALREDGQGSRTHWLASVATIVIAVLVIAALVYGRGFVFPDNNGAASHARTTPSPTSLPTVVTTPTPTPTPATAGWISYVNQRGHFTFSAPPEWAVKSCEDQNGNYVESSRQPAPCGRSEYYDAWLFGVSTTDRSQSQPFYTGAMTGSSDVVVDGVHGKRYTAVVDKSLSLPPPRGTVQVYYLFFDGSRYYSFVYNRWPGDPDRTADFDLMIQQTLKFRA